METQLIKGSTKLVGLIGNPVTHSISPIIHNHAFRKLNLPFAYIPLGVDEKNLSKVIDLLHVLNFAGANITIPYKTITPAYCDVLSDLSEVTGTVNTLFFKNGSLHGTTTDSEGFFNSLSHMNRIIKDDNIVILGNGGTARTLCYALAFKKNFNSLTIIGRNNKRVENLCAEINSRTSSSFSYTTFETRKCIQTLQNCTLLINCTSVGMHPYVDNSPIPADLFHDKMSVFDTIYNPPETLFLKNAAKAGCQVQNGLYMLLFQGLASFKYWTGVSADKELFDDVDINSFLTE
ncbi:MAG: shikimate dehydrogenase [Chitinispirillia bacterium]|jgi:shikimate dehydrogenase